MKQEIKQKIGKNKTEEVFSLLSKSIDEEHQNEFLLLQSRYTRLKDSDGLYISTKDQISADYNQLNLNLLNFIDKVFPPEAEAILEHSRSSSDIWKRFNDPKLRVLGYGITGLIFVLILISSLNFFNSQIFGKGISSNTLLIKVKAKNGIPLPTKGKVLLTYGNAQVSKEISNDDIATFTEIPNEYFREDSRVKITFTDPEGEPYFAIKEDSLYQLMPHQSIELAVFLKGLERMSGIVKDFVSGEFIAGARISVLDLETFSDENGWWELNITPAEKQRKFHTIRASKEGYQNWELSNVPAQVDKEIPIPLKQK